jgi:putative FmdB family regulatory protein
MPIYEYECLKCGKRTEVLQRLDEAPFAVCPECGGGLRKLISSPAFHFKGSGWYATDYAAKKGGDTESKESKSEPAAESKSESKAGEGAKADKTKETAAGTKSSGSAGGSE